MGVDWDDLVDVPQEAEEAPQEPWQVYMTDRGCKAATERISAEQKVSLAEAAVIAAKTVAPAPQNFAAHNARYLLAPEVEPEDETVLSREMGHVFGAEQFDAQAREAARRDGPSSPQGRRYSEGLANRAGESVAVQDADDNGSGEFEFAVQSALECRRPGADIPIPDRSDGPVRQLALKQMIREFSLHEAMGNRLLMSKIEREFTETLDEEDLIPYRPVEVELESAPMTNGLYQISLYLHAVPRNGREFQLQFLAYADPGREFTGADIDELRAINPCQEVRALLYGNVISVVSWPKHEHGTYRRVVSEDEFASRFMELFFNEG